MKDHINDYNHIYYGKNYIYSFIFIEYVIHKLKEYNILK